MKQLLKNKTIIIAVLVLAGAVIYSYSMIRSAKNMQENYPAAVLARFQQLSQNGNSSCSGGFKDSIASMPDSARLQGSCCSPMTIHRYSEQVAGLKKYKDILEIPLDPYDVDAKLAKQMLAHYDDQLTPDEQKAYDYAMANSMEKGPCCCKCWRWYVYGGLAKYLIKNYKFTGEQITDVWNLSDGCGGDGDHHHP